MEFIGRRVELEALEKLRRKKTASLVCILGRRRIGKSALIEQWGTAFSRVFEVQGLGPDQNASRKEQLAHFAQELAIRFKIPKPHLEDWDVAFDYLSKLTEKGEWLIFLDEISWMGEGDRLFAVKLKSAWDTKFKKNSRLILVVCGSVSTWIESNILYSGHFLGRVSHSINLKELSLHEIDQYWKVNNYHLGSLEKLLVLSITGGVPKYLEEILNSEPVTKALAKLCFDSGGILYRDFEAIFKEVFRRRTPTLEKILRKCLVQKFTPGELARELGTDHNSDFTEALHILEVSGFISRDFCFDPKSSKALKASRIRVNDNYTRFYLKVIEPMKKQIEKGGKSVTDLLQVKNLESILGYQLENLILNNRPTVHQILGIDQSQVRSSAPFFQKKEGLVSKGCQVDLLIHTELDVFFLCEIKSNRVVHNEVILEVKAKMKAIKIPKRSSLKPVLIYSGELLPKHQIEIERFFYKIIKFEDLFAY